MRPPETRTQRSRPKIHGCGVSRDPSPVARQRHAATFSPLLPGRAPSRVTVISSGVHSIASEAAAGSQGAFVSVYWASVLTSSQVRVAGCSRSVMRSGSTLREPSHVVAQVLSVSL